MLFVRDEVGSVQSYAMVLSLVAAGGAASLSTFGGAFAETIAGETTSEARAYAAPNVEPLVGSVAQAGMFGRSVGVARQAMRNAGVPMPRIDKAVDVAKDVLARKRTHIEAKATVFDSGDTLFVPTRADEAARHADFSGAAGTHLEVDSADTGFKRVVLVGLGDAQEPANMREIGHQIAKLARESNDTTSQVLLHSDYSADYKALTEGMLLADYNFDVFKSASPERTTLNIGVGAEGKYYLGRAQMGVDEGSTVAESVALSRDLTTLPSNVLDTNEMVALAALIADRRESLSFEILSSPDLLKENMNLHHGVGRASENPPYLVRLRHEGGGSRHVAAVGKGITFDTGGVDIKSNAMGMKGDMAGAGSVLAAIDGAAAQSVDSTVDVYLPLAHNAVSSNAQVPGDVVRGRSGFSVEIGNTDAEGRLVMADALAYATEDGPRKPDAIMTVATLTGANASTFGGEYAGLVTRYDAFAEQLLRAANTSDEKIWRMPMDEAYDSRLNSSIADMSNIGAGGAGAITAGIFLSKHVGNDVPFAHLDIAGTALRSSPSGRIPSGGTGSSTALLIDWFSSL